MEKEFGSWFHHQSFNTLLHNLNSPGSPFSSGLQSSLADFANPCANVVPKNGTSPAAAFPTLPAPKASQPCKPPRGWFYCLPCYPQAYASVPNCAQKEEHPSCLIGDINKTGGADMGSGCGQKRFLVVDQSGDQTTLIFSSGIGTPVQCMTSWNPKPPVACDLGELRAKIDLNKTPFGPHISGMYADGNSENDGVSDMQEDSEELNALLYSDDDYDYSEDEEVTSTGHSPNAMTVDDKQDWPGESGEKVASSDGPTKRQKLSDGSYDVHSFLDVGSSVKQLGCFKDDTDSSCGGSKNQELDEFGVSTGNKRSRKDKIRETVSILQSIIPNGKGKEAVEVLDEAINYLKSLKFNAKSLGLDTLRY